MVALCIALNPTSVFLFLKIFLQFEAFDLQLSLDCSSDYVENWQGKQQEFPCLAGQILWEGTTALLQCW